MDSSSAAADKASAAGAPQRRQGLPRRPDASASAGTPAKAEAPAQRQGLQRRPEESSAPAVAPTEAESATASAGSGRRRRAVLIVGVAAVVVIVAPMIVLFMRWFASLPFMQEFLTTFPGETPLPEGAPIGLPPWLGWQHFFTVFLMVLIIRSGLQLRRQKRPGPSWSPRWNPARKISLTLWFHQSLDLLWIVNGIVFVVLLIATGQWMRVVPTGWDVAPNALSAAIQYATLDWPTENGWVNYNSLQVLAYFTTIFIAAPLAALTGVRMSGIWPKNVARLDRIYPVELARRIHFPVMLYFIAFIVVHVTLVLATGALRNLNHMYAARGSADPGAFAGDATGLWIFLASVLVIAIAWIAARPLVLSVVARAFGRVSDR